MIRRHCGEKLLQTADTPDLAAWECSVCKKTFRQRKRQPGPVRRLVEMTSWVYCDIHCTVHAATTDPFGYGDQIPECAPASWRNLYVYAFTDEEETGF